MVDEMTKVCILQPNFIPWMGYFELIKSSDICIIYDTAQYSKNTFHNRNNLRLKSGDIFSWSLPLRKYKLGSNFNEIFVEYSPKDLKKLKSLILQNYSKSKYFYIFEELLIEMIQTKVSGKIKLFKHTKNMCSIKNQHRILFCI